MYKRILESNHNNRSFDTRKSIRRFGVRSGFQFCLENKLNKVLKIEHKSVERKNFKRTKFNNSKQINNQNIAETLKQNKIIEAKKNISTEIENFEERIRKESNGNPTKSSKKFIKGIRDKKTYPSEMELDLPNNVFGNKEGTFSSNSRTQTFSSNNMMTKNTLYSGSNNSKQSSRFKMMNTHSGISSNNNCGVSKLIMDSNLKNSVFLGNNRTYNRQKFHQGIRGVREDGFDIYKPTKMLQKKDWGKVSSNNNQFKGVLLKTNKGKTEKISKEKLYREVFLEDKVKEIQKIKEDNKKEMEILENFSTVKEMSKMHNERLRKALEKPIFIQKYGKVFTTEIT